MQPHERGLRAVDQVAIIVRDIDRAMTHYVDRLGIGPWDVYTYGPHRMHRMTFRGEERSYVMKLALTFVGSTMYELIESVQGPNIYEEFLASRGEGLHHLGYYVDDVEAEIAAMAAKGYPLLQSGHGFGADGDGAYAYFDTERDFGCILEAIELPKRMAPPERRYPQ